MWASPEDPRTVVATVEISGEVRFSFLPVSKKVSSYSTLHLLNPLPAPQSPSAAHGYPEYGSWKSSLMPLLPRITWNPRFLGEPLTLHDLACSGDRQREGMMSSEVSWHPTHTARKTPGFLTFPVNKLISSTDRQTVYITQSSYKGRFT